MKKILKVFICLFIALCFVGCSSNIDKTYDIDNQTIEKANVNEDYLIFEEIKSVYDNNLNKTNTNEQKCVVNLKYLDDIYQMTSNRFNLDADILSIFSDDYIEYVAICQVFSTSYLEEIETLIQDKKMISEDYIINNTQTGYMLNELKHKMDEFQTVYHFGGE